jgi:hypothetical protein
MRYGSTIDQAALRVKNMSMGTITLPFAELAFHTANLGTPIQTVESGKLCGIIASYSFSNR